MLGGKSESALELAASLLKERSITNSINNSRS